MSKVYVSMGDTGERVELTPETLAALVEFSEAVGKDPADVLKDAVAEYLNKKEGGNV